MSTQARTTSIEFLVDEASDALLARESSQGDDGAMTSEEVLRMPLQDVRARAPAEIQRAIGRLVLSFLNAQSSKGLNLPRDLDDEKQLDEEHFTQLLAAASSNEPEAVYGPPKRVSVELFPENAIPWTDNKLTLPPLQAWPAITSSWRRTIAPHRHPARGRLRPPAAAG